MYLASQYVNHKEKAQAVRGSVWLNVGRSQALHPPYIRGTGLGFLFGPLPTGGAEIPTFLSYTTESGSREGEARREFDEGLGAIEGVAGPEAANNASAAGTLIPLLTLGLPTSATAAMMLAGFQQYGLQPGPLLFTNNAELVWGLVASLFIANLMLVVLNVPFIGIWVKLLAIPRPWLYAGILTFATGPVMSVASSREDRACQRPSGRYTREPVIRSISSDVPSVGKADPNVFRYLLRPPSLRAPSGCRRDTISGRSVRRWIGEGGWRTAMTRVHLPTVVHPKPPWNRGRILGQKRPLLPKHVWAIRVRLELAGNLRDLRSSISRSTASFADAIWSASRCRTSWSAASSANA
jgi:hypothetical protein